MRTPREPQFASSADQNADDAPLSTRGIRKLRPRLGRPKPYGVQWSEQIWDPQKKRIRRKVTSEFFADERQRDKRHDELVRDKQRGTLAAVNKQEIAEWRAFQAATEGVAWQEVVAGWRAHLQEHGIKVHTDLIRDAAAEYLDRGAKLVAKGARSLGTHKKVKRHIDRLADHCGHLALDQIKGADLEDWIDGLEDVESEATFNTYRRDYHAFFEVYVQRGDLRRNPVDQIKLRDELNETVGVISIAQTARLLHTAHNYFDPRNGHRFRPIFARIVLETLAGLRTSSAVRLVKTDINFADRGITLPKRQLKTKKRHYISGFTNHLFDWLALAEERAWEPIELRSYRYLKAELFAAAGISLPPPNSLRHGFASYMLAAEKNPGLVAYWLCHTNQDQLWDHYNGRVTDADGRSFKTLSPAAAERLVADMEPLPWQKTPARETPAA